MSEVREQTTDTLLMIRPACFGFNSQTANTNIFQKALSASKQIHETALKEFDALVKKLREQKIYVIVLQDHEAYSTPDSIFPNNWVSFHEDKMVLYPMLAANRRSERRSDRIGVMKSIFGIQNIKDFSQNELQDKFLEGTGSMVLDRKNKVAYACISSRTNVGLCREWCDEMHYELVFFNALTAAQKEIYHTNILMAIGEKSAIMCGEVIRDEQERTQVLDKLSSHQSSIEISENQMLHFAGNMLLVKNRDGEKLWVMSSQAFESLTGSQKEMLQLDGNFLCADLKTIESAGGGSARCMIAEVFYPEI